MIVNDIHSGLNATKVVHIVTPESVEELSDVVKTAITDKKMISISGGRHAMGGQQFGKGNILIDMRAMNQIFSLDAENGQIEIGAGVQWPELIDFLRASPAKNARYWSIIQKQTGADRLTLGGSLAANVHGRGLKLKPIIGDVESFTMIDANGDILFCNRHTNSELFRLSIGGYGLFGVIARIQLRLMRREKLVRVVEMADIRNLQQLFEKRIADGFLYGDFQFSTDREGDDFLTKGVFSCYKPVHAETPPTHNHKELTAEDWIHLYTLGHTDHKKAFQLYSQFYLSTSGQIYDSDTHQLSYYLDDYHKLVDRELKSAIRATEMITEIYVPRGELVSFLEEAAEYFRKNQTEVFYGTIRLIEKDNESFLAWARHSFACVIFNLHVVHSADGRRKAKQAFRKLIELAIKRGGSYYLTYHRWATKKQVETCYPQLIEFLRLKKRYDPLEIFQSDWYRHYRKMFRSEL